MKKYYTTEEMIEFLECAFPSTEDDEDLVEAIACRLSAQNQHIDWMRERLVLAEKVIGELYLMQRETEQ